MSQILKLCNTSLRMSSMLEMQASDFINGAVVQIEKAVISDRCVQKFCIPTIYDFCSNLPAKFAIFFKK